MEDTKIIRCSWVNKDPTYIKYHDEEWGQPNYDNLYLFEMLCLEGQQAGLSWITILKRRESYQNHFFNFNPHRIAKISEVSLKRLLTQPGLIKHQKKLEAIVNNAQCYVKMENDGEDFSKFIWSFVNHKPVINNWINHKDIPTQSDTSRTLSKELKKRGFKFVGPTICYAFMEACGLINNHFINCICRSRKRPH